MLFQPKERWLPRFERRQGEALMLPMLIGHWQKAAKPQHQVDNMTT